MPIIPWFLCPNLSFWQVRQLYNFWDAENLKNIGALADATLTFIDQQQSHFGFLMAKNNNQLQMGWVGSRHEKFRNHLESAYPGLIAVPRPGGPQNFLKIRPCYPAALTIKNTPAQETSNQTNEIDPPTSFSDYLTNKLNCNSWLYVVLALSASLLPTNEKKAGEEQDKLNDEKSEATTITAADAQTKPWQTSRVLFLDNQDIAPDAKKLLLDYFASAGSPVEITSCSRLPETGSDDIHQAPFTLMSSKALCQILVPPRTPQPGYTIIPTDKPVIKYNSDPETNRKALLGITTNPQPTSTYFDVSHLTTPTLITGSSPDSLHDTSSALLYQFWRNNKIPFLIFDISESSNSIQKYQDVFGEDLTVYQLGGSSKASLSLELLSYREDQEDDNQCFPEYIDNIIQAFAIAFPETSLPTLAPLCKTVFSRWLDPQQPDSYGFPDYPSLIKTIEAVSKDNSLSYDKVTSEALETSLINLFHDLSNKESEEFIFNKHELASIWETLFKKPSIIRMKGINGRAIKTLTLLLFLNRLRKQAIKESRQNPLRLHLTLINELHQLIPNEQSGLQKDATTENWNKMSDSLFSINYTGEGFIFIDSSPSLLPDTILKNTGQKIIHKFIDEQKLRNFADTAELDNTAFRALAGLSGNTTLWQTHRKEPQHLQMVKISEGHMSQPTRKQTKELF